MAKDIYCGVREMIKNDTILVSVDFNHGTDHDLLVVGRKCLGHDIEIINAFQGPEARELYNKLVTKKETPIE